MFSAGFDPSFPAVQRPQSYALDRTAIILIDSLKNITLKLDAYFYQAALPHVTSRVSPDSQVRFLDSAATSREAIIILLCCCC
jgi:hypothetical protein